MIIIVGNIFPWTWRRQSPGWQDAMELNRGVWVGHPWSEEQTAVVTGPFLEIEIKYSVGCSVFWKVKHYELCDVIF